MECPELLCPSNAKASDLEGDGCPDTCVCPDNTFTTQDEPCSDSLKCTVTKECDDGFFCAKPLGLCEAIGDCKMIPEGCEDTGNTVCACNGKLFESECMANQFGFSVAPKGLCDTGG